MSVHPEVQTTSITGNITHIKTNCMLKQSARDGKTNTTSANTFGKVQEKVNVGVGQSGLRLSLFYGGASFREAHHIV